MKYTKKEIEQRLKDVLYDCLSSSNQEDGIVSLEYDENKRQCIVVLNVHIVEGEDNYIGFSVY